MNNPFEYLPYEECIRAFHELEERIERLGRSGRPEDISAVRELESGKMLGVLIAEDSGGRHHTLHAFSGQLGEAGFYFPGFVDPVFDYLQPGGYFKRKESEISRQNIDISRFERETLPAVRMEYEAAKERTEEEVRAFKEKCRLSKEARDARRAGGKCTMEEEAAMIRESQYEKAELRRIRKRVAVSLEPYVAKYEEAMSQLDAMKEKRRGDSENLQKWLFDNFRVHDAGGNNMSLSDIFADTPMGVPPSGAGECCGPKLLQAAYMQGLRPLAMAEYWYGSPKGGEVRVHGQHYPACRGKCRPVLGFMLGGLTVEPPLENEDVSASEKAPVLIFENEWFCIVDKPSGMLSVPGRIGGLSVQEWLIAKYGEEREVKVAHRLDQDTSGLLIATFGCEAYREMQRMFATRKIKKTYVAVLEGDYREKGIARKGRIELPLGADWLERPRQRVDREGGKEAVTEYEFMDVKDGRSRVMFYPHTGRTHQLRVHAASAEGLGMPIVGDRLYGRGLPEGAGRLMLHAERVEFEFRGERICATCGATITNGPVEWD